MFLLLICHVDGAGALAIREGETCEETCLSCVYQNPPSKIPGVCRVLSERRTSDLRTGDTQVIRGAWGIRDAQQKEDAVFLPNKAMMFQCTENGAINFIGEFDERLNRVKDIDHFCQKKCVYPPLDTIPRKTGYPLRPDPCEYEAPIELLTARLKDKGSVYAVSSYDAKANQYLTLSTAVAENLIADIKIHFPSLWKKHPTWLKFFTKGETVRSAGDACIVINTQADQELYPNPDGSLPPLGYWQCDSLVVYRRKSAPTPYALGPHDIDYCRASVSGQLRGEFVTKKYDVWRLIKKYPPCTFWDYFKMGSKCGTREYAYEGVEYLTKEMKRLDYAEVELVTDFTTTVQALMKFKCYEIYHINVGRHLDQRYCPKEKQHYRIGSEKFHKYDGSLMIAGP